MRKIERESKSKNAVSNVKPSKNQPLIKTITFDSGSRRIRIDNLLHEYHELLEKGTGKFKKQILAFECPATELEALDPCRADTSIIAYSAEFIDKTRPLLFEFMFAHEYFHHVNDHFKETVGELADKSDGIDRRKWREEFNSDAWAFWLMSKMKGSWLEKDEVDLIFADIRVLKPNDTKNSSTHPSFENRRNHLQLQQTQFVKIELLSSVRDNILLERVDSLTESFIDVNELFLSAEQKIARIEKRKEEVRLKKNEKIRVDSLRAMSVFERSWIKLRTTIDKNLMDSLVYARDSVIIDYNRKAKIDYLINKIYDANSDSSEEYFTVEPILGGGIFGGRISKNDHLLDTPLKPLYKVGLRMSKQIWYNQNWFYTYITDITFNQTRMDIHQVLENKNQTIERIDFKYLQAIPRIGVARRLTTSSSNSIHKSTKTNFLTFSAGIPLHWNKLAWNQYENFLLAGDEAIQVRWNNIHWDALKTQGSILQRISNTNIFQLANLSFQLAYHHSSRVGAGWSRMKHFLSYSVALSYHRPFLSTTIKNYGSTYTNENKPNTVTNRVGFYDITFSCRWWR